MIKTLKFITDDEESKFLPCLREALVGAKSQQKED